MHVRGFEYRSAKVAVLVGIAGLLLFVELGTAELWTQEGRWAAISAHMIQSGDHFHPYLFGHAYYDKPLLSYWLMIAAACLVGQLNELAMRLPSALSGMAAVACLYRLGSRRFDPAIGLIAGYLLVSCYMFVFWARVASADMLNLAGTLAAVTWYFERRDRPGFVTFGVLSATVALTCLMKGLIGAAIVSLVMLPDLLRERRWRRFLHPTLFPAIAVGLAIYLVPFAISSMNAPPGHAESGLGAVFRENVIRYVDPFDHQEPVYIYLLELPVYLLPWSLFLPFVLWGAWRRWPTLGEEVRWVLSSCLLVLLFLTVSGSRRSYYILPLVPFALLATAEWVQSVETGRWAKTTARYGVIATVASMLVWFGVAVPWGFRKGGERQLVREVRADAERIAPWNTWQVLLCGAPPAAGYYFRTDTEPALFEVENIAAVPAFLAKKPRTILITKRRFVDTIRAFVPTASVHESRSRLPSFMKPKNGSERDVIAFVPRGAYEPAGK